MWGSVGKRPSIHIPQDRGDAGARDHGERPVSPGQRKVKDDLFAGAREKVDVHTDEERWPLLPVDDS